MVREALNAFNLVNSALGLMGMSSSDFQEEVKAKRMTAMGLSKTKWKG